MKWWSRFWKARKQDDRVKVIFLFYLAGVFFLSSAFYTGIRLYQSVNVPAEYILSVASETGVTDAQLKELKKMDGVSVAGRQSERDVMLTVNEVQISFPCLIVSKEYMKYSYGIEKEGAMKTFYLNQAALNQLMMALKETGEDISDTSEIQAEYQMSDTDISDVGIAKLEVLKRAEDGTAPYLFCTAGSAELAASTSKVRVRTEGQDLDGQQLKQFQDMGFQVVNEAARKQESLRQGTELLKIRYQAITAVVCLLAAQCLRRWRKSS